MFGTRKTLLFFPIVAALALTACDAGGRPDIRDGGPGTDGSIPGTCTPGVSGFICRGNQSVECRSDGTDGPSEDCGASGQICVHSRGCLPCRPGAGACEGNQFLRCNAEGTDLVPERVCDPAASEVCSTSGCVNPCVQAEATNSYIGCEYWPTPTANSVYDGFDFAIVIANPQASPVEARITRGGAAVTTAIVPASGAEVVRLPWVTALKEPHQTTGDTRTFHSSVVAGGAYRVQTNLPVTVYQFNPLEYRLDRDCPDQASDQPGDNACFSFSNDASLLFPAHVMTGNYIAMARPTFQLHRRIEVVGGETQEGTNLTPGFITVTAVAEGTTMVGVTAGGSVLASADGSTVSAMARGESATFTLQQGDVLQLVSGAPSTCAPGSPSDTQTGVPCGALPPPFGPTCNITDTYCDVGDDHDLTGTEVQASQPVMLLGGHTCTFVPHNRWACDHLEESIFPLEAWGRDFLVAVTEPLRSEPNVVRIVSGADDNTLTFEPASVAMGRTLQRGESIEFETANDFRVVGTGPLLVGQFLVGQDYAGVGTSGDMGLGDPSMSLAVPTEQFRTSYTFLAPSTFERSYVNVIAPAGASVTLSSNGGVEASVPNWREVGTTGMQTARVQIPGGTHTMTSSRPFGIVVYGFGRFTSYMYPGGLDLETINIF